MVAEGKWISSSHSKQKQVRRQPLGKLGVSLQDPGRQDAPKLLGALTGAAWANQPQATSWGEAGLLQTLCPGRSVVPSAGGRWEGLALPGAAASL